MGIEVLVGKHDQHWLKRVHIGKVLAIDDIHTSLNSLEKWKMLTRQQFKPTRFNPPGQSGPKFQENKTDKFLSVYDIIYTITNSRKDKGNAPNEYILKDIVPRGINAKIAEFQEKH